MTLKDLSVQRILGLQGSGPENRGYLPNLITNKGKAKARDYQTDPSETKGSINKGDHKHLRDPFRPGSF